MSTEPKNSLQSSLLPGQKELKSINRQIAQHADQYTDWTGVKLREIRLLRQLSIEEISKNTKISKVYIQAIENEEVEKLPAPVYIRGFVTQLSKTLKLPHEKVATSYMERISNKIPDANSIGLSNSK